MSDPSERVATIETTLAYLEHQYDQLNLEVLRQSKQLDRLRAQMHELLQVLKLEELERVKANQKMPPHTVWNSK